MLPHGVEDSRAFAISGLVVLRTSAVGRKWGRSELNRLVKLPARDRVTARQRLDRLAERQSRGVREGNNGSLIDVTLMGGEPPRFPDL